MCRRIPLSLPALPRALCSTAAVLAFLFGASRTQAADERPNILFIFADDVSYRNIGCYEGSYDWVRTPHIDRLAEAGVRFTRGYVGAWCMPSRATMMTGHHQYGNNSLRLRPASYPAATYRRKKMPLWPSALRENGYFTGMIGKWHLGRDDGWGHAWDYQKVWNRSKYTKNASAYYEDQIIVTNGGKPELVEGYPTDFYTDWATDFIKGEGRDEDKPWFLWLCYGAAHGPFKPAERHLDLFPEAHVPAPADVFPPRPGKPFYMQKINTWTEGSDGRPKLFHFRTPKGGTDGIHGPDISDWNRQIQQTIASLDEGVDRLIEALDESGQRRKTLIVFTADQGFAMGQHGFATKMAPYDANIRPPLIFSHPGSIPSGTICKHPVSGPDIVSTLLAQAETPEPWFMHGHDFSELLKNPGRKEWEHGAVLAMTGVMWGKDTDNYPVLIKHTQGIPWWFSYSKGKYKYIRIAEPNEIEEFYDLEADPEELNNLALDPSYHDLIREYRTALVEELRRTKPDHPKRNGLPPVFPLTDNIAEEIEDSGSMYRKKEGFRPFAARRVLDFIIHRIPPKILY